MRKKFIYPFVFFIVLILSAVLWLLSEMYPDDFGFFNLSFAIALLTLTGGIIFILQGLFEKNIVIVKKFRILLGAGLLIITVFSLISAIAIPDNLIMPIIAIIVTVALFLSYIAVGGKKWDQGDNKKVGYKNYYQRKKEEEKKKS